MIQTDLEKDYFNWVSFHVCGGFDVSESPFEKLLLKLYNTEFIYIIDKDKNRYNDGLTLRYLYSLEMNDPFFETMMSEIPCNILEMMVALATRCETTIADDPDYGDRTAQWFWSMVSSLGLNGMTNDNYDEEYVTSVLSKFLNRQYEPNGKGGLFTIKDKHNMPEVEIWTQLRWYIKKYVL